MKVIIIPGGGYGDALATGEYISVINGAGVQTDKKFIPLESFGNDCMFSRIHPDGEQFAGKSHEGGFVLIYNNGWNHTSQPTYGNSPVIFNDGGDLAISERPGQFPGVGATGFSHINYDTKELVGHDSCNGGVTGLAEWVYIGNGIRVGQGVSGKTVVNDNGTLRVLSQSGPSFLRYHRVSNNLAFYYYTNVNGINTGYVTLCTLSEIQNLPLLNPVEPPVSLKKPEVSVINWNLDELKNGREFSFIDRENPGFGARVWTEDGSMFASFTNPVGTGRTGAARKFKECKPISPPIEPPIIPPGTISRIRVDNLVFRDEQNNIFPYCFASSFLLFKRFLDGEDIRPYVKAWSALGYNGFRVFGQCSWNAATGLPDLIVSDYPNYFTSLPSFLNLLSQEGMYCELVTHTYPYGINEQVDYVNKIAAIASRHKNIFIELTNEPDVNGINIEGLVSRLNTSAWNFPWATGVYSFNGANTGLPKGSYVTVHLDRGNEWPRKFRQLLEYRTGGVVEGAPALNCPIPHDEPIGGWIDSIPGRRSNVPSDFHSHGAGCQLMGAGGTYHHESGRNSVMPVGLELECAKAFVTGLRLVTPTFQLGEYTRIGLGNCPIIEENSLGTWGMIVGNLACMVRVRPFGTYTVHPDWKILAEDSQKIVITMARK